MDSLGRYTLTDMEDRIRRMLSANRITVNTTTGAETSNIIQNQIFSNTDITQQVNTSLMMLYSEVVLAQPDQFSQTFYISVLQDNPGPYAFPFGMLQLRYMDWKPENTPISQMRPNMWIEMLPLGDPMDRDISNDFGAPTWEYDSSGTAFVLSSWPDRNNDNGIRIRAVVLPPALAGGTDVIQARFVRVMQEAVIYDAAYALAWSKLKQVTDEMASERTRWHDRLIATAENAFHPPSAQMVTGRLISNNYSGRRNRQTTSGRNW